MWPCFFGSFIIVLFVGYFFNIPVVVVVKKDLEGIFFLGFIFLVLENPK